jgi:hypothetical protein
MKLMKNDNNYGISVTSCLKPDFIIMRDRVVRIDYMLILDIGIKGYWANMIVERNFLILAENTNSTIFDNRINMDTRPRYYFNASQVKIIKRIISEKILFL